MVLQGRLTSAKVQSGLKTKSQDPVVLALKCEFYRCSPFLATQNPKFFWWARRARAATRQGAAYGRASRAPFLSSAVPELTAIPSSSLTACLACSRPAAPCVVPPPHDASMRRCNSPSALLPPWCTRGSASASTPRHALMEAWVRDCSVTEGSYISLGSLPHVTDTDLSPGASHPTAPACQPGCWPPEWAYT